MGYREGERGACQGVKLAAGNERIYSWTGLEIAKLKPQRGGLAGTDRSAILSSRRRLAIMWEKSSQNAV